jgi:hypothetical protein
LNDARETQVFHGPQRRNAQAILRQARKRFHRSNKTAATAGAPFSMPCLFYRTHIIINKIAFILRFLACLHQ